MNSNDWHAPLYIEKGQK